MSLAGWFRRRPEPAGAAALKARLRAHLGLGEEDALTVSEIACPSCGADAVETIVLVMRRGERTVALKCLRSMSELEADPSLIAELGAEADEHRAKSRPAG